MSQQTTIRKLAELVNTPVEKLLEQLAGAGMKFSGPDQVVTSSEKVKLLGFLRRSHGKPEQAPEETDQSAKKITLNRRKQQEVTVNSGRSKTTVNVEVRQKRTYVKDGARAMTPDEERADILRKLEESRARNLAEQQALAEKDRLRDEAIVRAREEEAAAKERAEAEKKAAEEAAAAAKAAETLAASKPKRAPIDETAPRPPRGHVLLDDVQRDRRQELAVRQHVQSFARAGDAGEPLYMVVPRRDVGIADRPVGGDAILEVRFEVQVGKPIALPAPHQRAPAYVVATEPVEALGFDVG